MKEPELFKKNGHCLELVCDLVTWLKNGSFTPPLFPFFQFRSAATQRKKGEKLTKNCSFSDAVGLGLPEIKRHLFGPTRS